MRWLFPDISLEVAKRPILKISFFVTNTEESKHVTFRKKKSLSVFWGTTGVLSLMFKKDIFILHACISYFF